jgi:type IV pilus assembly protein PilP
MKNTMIRSVLPMLVLAGSLSGCIDSDEQEIKQWMAETKAQTQPHVKAIKPPTDFVPFAYTSNQAVDPFSANKLLIGMEQKSGSNLKPDMDRRKELLESYPLDTIRMVGTIRKAGTVYALLQIDRSVYQVRAGQHLGQDYGLVTSVTEEAVNLKEIVQDATGDWVERMSKLELQESVESKK